MAWDIHGNRLEHGHCEVHPWVAEEYPCTICLNDMERANRSRQLNKQYDDLVEKQHLDAQRNDYAMANSAEYVELTARRDELQKELVRIEGSMLTIMNNLPF